MQKAKQSDFDKILVNTAWGFLILLREGLFYIFLCFGNDCIHKECAE